jgi:hypothetical protein
MNLSRKNNIVGDRYSFEKFKLLATSRSEARRQRQLHLVASGPISLDQTNKVRLPQIDQHHSKRQQTDCTTANAPSTAIRSQCRSFYEYNILLLHLIHRYRVQFE